MALAVSKGKLHLDSWLNCTINIATGKDKNVQKKLLKFWKVRKVREFYFESQKINFLKKSRGKIKLTSSMRDMYLLIQPEEALQLSVISIFVVVVS